MALCVGCGSADHAAFVDSTAMGSAPVDSDAGPAGTGGAGGMRAEAQMATGGAAGSGAGGATQAAHGTCRLGANSAGMCASATDCSPGWTCSGIAACSTDADCTGGARCARTVLDAAVKMYGPRECLATCAGQGHGDCLNGSDYCTAVDDAGELQTDCTGKNLPRVCSPVSVDPSRECY